MSAVFYLYELIFISGMAVTILPTLFFYIYQKKSLSIMCTDEAIALT